jgi:UDP-3-O-[3-hydroxymyristoyl] glucosamine N-acyltransferase
VAVSLLSHVQKDTNASIILTTTVIQRMEVQTVAVFALNKINVLRAMNAQLLANPARDYVHQRKLYVPSAKRVSR